MIIINGGDGNESLKSGVREILIGGVVRLNYICVSRPAVVGREALCG